MKTVDKEREENYILGYFCLSIAKKYVKSIQKITSYVYLKAREMSSEGAILREPSTKTEVNTVLRQALGKINQLQGVEKDLSQ